MRLTATLSLLALVTIATAAAVRQDPRDGGQPLASAGPAPVERTDVVQTGDGQSIRLRLLLQPHHVDQADRYVAATKAALTGYGRLLGPFPAAMLTIVDPIVDGTSPDLEPGVTTSRRPERPSLHRGQSAVIVAGSHWYSPWTTAEPEMAVVLGIGRVYWRAQSPMNDERLGEALATFTAARVFADAFPGRFVRTRRYFRGLVAWPYGDAPWTKDVNGYLADVALDPTASSADIGRAHDVLALATLERLVGAETMDRVLRAYAARGTSDAAASADFETIAREISSQDLTSFFDATRRRDVAFDYGVDMPSTGARASSAVVRRLAAGAFPVDVRVTFDDGSSRVERWDGRDDRHAFAYAAGAAIASVEIDPAYVLRLDVRRANNSWSASPRGARAARLWSLRWLAWFQHALMDYAFFA
jgi:hypothetical protein